MLALWFTTLLTAFAELRPPKVAGDWVEAIVARVPAGLSIARDVHPRSNLAYFRRCGAIRWSDDGRKVAYAGIRGNEYFPVVGDTVGESYVFASTPVVADGRAFFLVVRDATPSTQTSWLWIDGVTLPPEDSMGPIAVSPSGKQVAFWTWPGAKVGNVEPPTTNKHYLALATLGDSKRWTVKRGDAWFDPGILAPQFSLDGSAVVSCAVGSQGYELIKLAGGREFSVSDSAPLIEDFSVSANGHVIAFVTGRARRPNDPSEPGLDDPTELYFKNKRVGKRHAGIMLPTVSPDGDHVGYVVLVDGRRSVAIDEEKDPKGRYDHVDQMAFDRAGGRLAFVANVGGRMGDMALDGGEWFVVVRTIGAKDAPAEHSRFREVRDLVWDAKGERLAYCARDSDGWRIVCGDVRSDPHAYVGAPVFSADGKTIGYGSCDGREIWWRVLPLD